MSSDIAKAIQLQKSKHNTMRPALLSKQNKQERMNEKMDYYKAQLQNAIVQKQADSVQQFFQKLITVRAEQFAFNIQTDPGKMSDEKSHIEKELKQYYQDCYALSLSLGPLLSH